MALTTIDTPPLNAVAQGLAQLWAIEAKGFSPDGNLLLVKATYSDSAFTAVTTRTAFWIYDLSQGKYTVCVNKLIASDRPLEVSDVVISQSGGKTQLVATYHDTGVSEALDPNKLALISDSVLIQADLVASLSGNQADASITALRSTADGRFIVLETAATNLVRELDTNGSKDIFVLDQLLHTVRRITTVSGAEPVVDSLLGDARIGADGSLSVAFQSSQAFTTQDSNAADDVFVWRLAATQFASTDSGAITLVSRMAAGAVGGSNPLLNANGLLFESESSAFNSNDLNGANDVWQSTGSTVTAVSSTGSGTFAQASSLADSSSDGLHVALVSSAPDVAGGVDQLLLINPVTHESLVVSKAADGSLADDAVISPVLSANGSAVAFSSQASNLSGTAPDGLMHLFLYVSPGKTVDMLAYSWSAHTLLNGVSLDAEGRSASTDAGGSASFATVPGTALGLTASRAIPANEAAATDQAVNLQDAIAILKMIVGLDVNGAGKALSPYQAYAADYDGNGKVELSDAIGVLKHVVGLDAPKPQWLFFNEIDATVPGKANLLPGSVPALSVDLSGASPVHVGLVGVLRGDVDGSYAGATGALDLDTDATHKDYFSLLLAAHKELSPSQFGVYP